MRVEFVVFLVCLISFSIAIPWMARSILWNRAMKALRNGNDEKAEEIFKSKSFVTLFGKFHSEWNLLRLSLVRSDSSELESRVRRLLDQDLSRSQRVQVAKAAYFFFLDKENAEMSKKLLTVIQESKDKKEVKQNEILYRVLIEKKHEDIESVKEMLQDLEKGKEMDMSQVGLLQYILGLQYMYAKDDALSKQYLKKAKGNLKDTPYHKKIKKLLGK